MALDTLTRLVDLALPPRITLTLPNNYTCPICGAGPFAVPSLTEDHVKREH